MQPAPTIPLGARALVIFAYAGPTRTSAAEQSAMQRLHDAGIATLVLNLLTPDEEARHTRAGTLRLDVPFLAKRIVSALNAARRDPEQRGLRIALLGIGIGGPAALVAAAARPEIVTAVVCHEGRPDVVKEVLDFVTVPNLLRTSETDGGVDHAAAWLAEQLNSEQPLDALRSA